MPKISVIIPAFNHEKYIADTLRSVLNQKISDVEIVVVNDGSTDSTGDILDAFARKDDRVKVYHKKNGGVVSAINEAMKHATGEWLAWCGSDDIVPYNSYSDLLKKSRNCDVVIGEFSEITDFGDCVRVRMQRWRKQNCFDALFSMPAMWSKIIRRSFIKEHDLWFPEVKLCEDLIFLANIAIRNPRYAVVMCDVYHYRNNSKQISNSMTHTYSADYFKAHIDGRVKVLEICNRNSLCNAYNYVFIDSLYFLSEYLLQMDSKDVDFAMNELKQLISHFDWKLFEKHFENVFGISIDKFMPLNGQEYVNFILHEDSEKRVLRKFRAGNIGLQFVFKCIKSWIDFKIEPKKKKY